MDEMWMLQVVRGASVKHYPVARRDVVVAAAGATLSRIMETENPFSVFVEDSENSIVITVNYS